MRLDAMKLRLAFPDARGTISALLHMNLLGGEKCVLEFSFTYYRYNIILLYYFDKKKCIKSLDDIFKHACCSHSAVFHPKFEYSFCWENFYDSLLCIMKQIYR